MVSQYRFIFVMLFGFSFSGNATSISSSLKFCDTDCSCVTPYLAQEKEYIIRPEDVKKKSIQCSLSMDEVKKLLKCASTLTQSRNISCLPLSSINYSFNIKQSIDSTYSKRLPYKFMSPISESAKAFISKPKDVSTTEVCDLPASLVLPATTNVAEKAPANCGYKWKHFNRPEYFKLTQHFIDTDDVKCSKSMCTSASFLALIAQAKSLKSKGLITDKQFEELTVPHKSGYKMLNTSAEPNELVEKFGIGTGYSFNIKDKKFGKGVIPQIGDLAQIWRKNGSGHSVVFNGFIDEDEDGVNDLMCYWSSQKVSNGYGHVCEKIKTMSRVLVGHFSQTQ